MQQSNGNNVMVQGRLVWVTGPSMFEGKQKTDFNTNQPVFGQDGSPVKEYGFGLAVPKVDPKTGQNTEEFTKLWQALHQEAFTLFPNGKVPPNFSMKFKDGDGIDHNGKSFADREGYAGHIVLACTTQIPIKFFRFEGGNNILVNDGIKCGDYVNVQLNIKAHPAKAQGKAGLYVNPSAVQLIQQGKEIINTPSGDQIFGQAAPAYSGQVVADQAPAMPNMQGMPNTQQPPMQGMPNMQAQQQQQAPMQAQPHYDVLPNNMQPQQQQPPMQGMPNMQPQQQQGAPAMPPMPPMGQ